LVVDLPLGVRPGKLRRPIREALQQFGLKRLRVASTHTGHCRGFAVADVTRPEAALVAISNSNGIALSTDSIVDGVAAAPAIAQLSRSCGGKVDSLFPFVPEPVRRKLQLDAEALHSTLDQALGVHISNALTALCQAVGVDFGAVSAIDGCACCGGSVLMLHSAFGGRIIAVEADEARAALLGENLALLCPDGRASALRGDFCALWPSLTPAGVIFLDVPWGGPRYGELGVIDGLELGGVPLPQLIASLAMPSGTEPKRMAAPLLAVRLPRNFDTDALASELSRLWADWAFRWDPVLQQPERPMPFRIDLGGCGVLLAVCVCGAAAVAGDFLVEGFRLAGLDDLVAALRSWDGEGGHRHRVAFFDWEAARWVPLSRWKGCKPGLRSAAAGAPPTPPAPRRRGVDGARRVLPLHDELSGGLHFYRAHRRTTLVGI